MNKENVQGENVIKFGRLNINNFNDEENFASIQNQQPKLHLFGKAKSFLKKVKYYEYTYG